MSVRLEAVKDASPAEGLVASAPPAQFLVKRKTNGEFPRTAAVAMSLRRQEYGVPDPESLAWLAERGGEVGVATGGPGTLTPFERNTMHGSNSNITPYPRSNVFLVYNSVENANAPFGGMRPRPGCIANRGFTALSPG